MSVFTLNGTILLVGVWARHSMFDANVLEILVKLVVLASPI
jgi:hypothetical protein